jgi:hypothetical protein
VILGFLAIAIVAFYVWLMYTAFYAEDPALDNTIEDDYYE